MENKNKSEPAYLWQFINENLDGIDVFAAIAVAENDECCRNMAIKARDAGQHFSVTFHKKGWNFAKDEEVSVGLGFMDGNNETLAAFGDGNILDILLPMSAAPQFLYLLATSEVMEVSFPGRTDEPWNIGLMFAEPSISSMIRRLMGKDNSSHHGAVIAGKPH